MRSFLEFAAPRLRKSLKIDEVKLAMKARREIKEELPKLKVGRVRLWKEVTSKNRRSVSDL